VIITYNLIASSIAQVPRRRGLRLRWFIQV